MRVIVIGVLCISMLVGCGGRFGTVVLTETSAGSVVSLEVGDVLEVALEANPSTGYTWDVSAGSTPCVELAGEPVFTPMADLLGAGAVMLLEFDVVQEGEGDLVLMYHRPWEDAAPLREFVVSVAVTR